MKKYIVSILSIALIVSALAFTTAQALTLSDISMLQAAGIISSTQAAALSAAIGASTPAVVAAPTQDSTSCAVISTTVGYGSKDTEANGNSVSILQDFLAGAGYLKTSASNFGFYGRMTVAAVKAFQSANGLTVTGTANATTRAKIQDMDCNEGKTIQNTTDQPQTYIVPANIPSIHLTAKSNGQSSDTSITVNQGNTITVSGAPMNLSGVRSRAYFFDQTWGNNSMCGNNSADDSVWTFTCTASVGSTDVYVEIYENGKVYRSNTVKINVLPPVQNYTSSIAPVITSTGGKAAGNLEMYAGQPADVYGTNLSNITAVFLGGSALTINSKTNNTISVNVPASFTSGNYNLYVADNNRMSNTLSINVKNNQTTSNTATSCTTQNTIMMSGQIGCDIVANGTFDLSKSYCEGQTTKRRQTGLMKDLYGRLNYYWTTLTGLNNDEQVNVYINSNGNNIQCSPNLNTKAGFTQTTTPAPVITSLFAPSPISVGQEVMLNWTTTNATSCSLEKGSLAPQGSYTITGAASTFTTTLACTGPGGTATKSITVIVNPAPTTQAPIIYSLNPTSGPAGTIVTINGNGFVGLNSKMTISGPGDSQLPNLNVISPTTATFIVPSNWPTGSQRIYAEAFGVTGQSTAYFTVTQTAGSSTTSSSNTATSCTTQGTIMTGSGEIGCDIVANGSFNVANSFCVGLISGKRQNLQPDALGRANRYYATLTGLNPAEQVNVYINSNGNNIQCSPNLNVQANTSGSASVFNAVLSGWLSNFLK